MVESNITPPLQMEVRRITYTDVKPWLLFKHYAHRLCPVSWAFGLFCNNVLEGIVTYGRPASHALRIGVCGPAMKDMVYELNRLCINSTAPKNAASKLVGVSLRLLPRGFILVSFADTAYSHIGYVYQATNWIYTGLSAKRTDWKIKGMEYLHGITIADKFRGRNGRAKCIREQYGDAFYLMPRPRKHRYVYFTDKSMEPLLRYPRLPYPKGESRRYECIDV